MVSLDDSRLFCCSAGCVRTLLDGPKIGVGRCFGAEFWGLIVVRLEWLEKGTLDILRPYASTVASVDGQ